MRIKEPICGLVKFAGGVGRNAAMEGQATPRLDSSLFSVQLSTLWAVRRWDFFRLARNSHCAQLEDVVPTQPCGRNAGESSPEEEAKTLNAPKTPSRTLNNPKASLQSFI